MEVTMNQDTGIDTDEARWRAVYERDAAVDRTFVFAVNTTGV